jgi:hypothetical protein
MAFLRFIFICFIRIGGFKNYGLSQVMGYHSTVKPEITHTVITHNL